MLLIILELKNYFGKYDDARFSEFFMYRTIASNFCEEFNLAYFGGVCPTAKIGIIMIRIIRNSGRGGSALNRIRKSAYM